MSTQISRIVITFPVPVDPTKEQWRQIEGAIDAICEDYKKTNPDRVMWLFGSGAMMTTNPFMVDEDHPMTFDDSTQHYEVAEREKY